MRLLIASLVPTLAIAACVDQSSVPPRAPGRHVAVSVAPLTLEGVTRADYTLTVTNGDDEVVTAVAVDSTRYGDGAGSLSYVAPCDADLNPNTVTLTVEALYDAGGELPDGSWLAPAALSREVSCVEGADAYAGFDLTIARAAKQGFFDVAISFDEIFCSAKLDCENLENTAGGQDLDLLLNPETGARDMTAVLALACTADPSGGGSTYLYLDDLRVSCDDGAVATIDPSGIGQWALDDVSDAGGTLFAAGVFRGAEQLANKAYWNVAVGLEEAGFDADCTLTATGTASDQPLVEGPGGFTTPAGVSYPVITWDVQLTTAGARVCGQAPLDGASSPVVTQYTPLDAPAVFRHQLDLSNTVTSVAAPPARGTWQWDSAIITVPAEREAFFDFAAERRIDRVFAHVWAPLGTADEPEIMDFVADAAARGIATELLAGDPLWARADHHADAIAFADAAVAVAQSVGGPDPAALHFDIEPYILSEWSTDREGLANQYLDVLEALASIAHDAGMEIVVDTPFWFDTIDVSRDGAPVRPLSELVLDRVDRVVVLAFRDTAGLIEDFGSDEIAYAGAIGKQVILAVETQDIVNLTGEPEWVTFFEEGAAALEDALTQVRDDLNGDAGYGGLAVHHYESWAALDP